MREIIRIVESLQETDEMVSHMNRAIEQRPNDEILKINAEAVAKRHQDLVRRLDYVLHTKQAELVQYRIQRDWSASYPAKAVAATMTSFQELVTAVFDAIKTQQPKRQYRPSSENVNLSTFDFAGAGMGSVIISLSVPDDRLLIEETDFEKTLSLVERALMARESEEIKLLADEIGIAAITKAYSWAQASVSYGLDTKIHWGKSYDALREITISRNEASIVKDIIESKSETEEYPDVREGILHGFDGATSYFHLETFDDQIDLRGTVSPEMSKSWTTGQAYRARLLKTVQVRYATGEERVTWTLLALEPIDPTPLLDNSAGR